MDDRVFFPTKAIEARSSMNSALLFEGSDDVFVSFDIETYSPNGFPHNMEDPIVNFSLALPIFKDLRKGLLTISYICHPSLEEKLLRLLHSFLSLLEGNLLLTYNGSKFDVKYVAHRGNLFGLDFQKVFSNFLHVDLYKLVKCLNIKLPSYSQKAVEEYLGFKRAVNDVSGASYHSSFASFLRCASLKPVFYNVEDSVGCLRILEGLFSTLRFKFQTLYVERGVI